MNDLSSLHRSVTNGAAIRREALRLLEGGKVGDAEAMLAPLVARHHDDGKLLHLYGAILSRLPGRLKDAVMVLERAEGLLGADGGLLADLGQAYLALKRRARAAAKLTAATELRPDLAAAWFALGRLHEEASAWGEAARCLARTVALAPKAVDAWILLGGARDQLGEYDGAIAAYREALRLVPHHAAAIGAMAKTEEAFGHRDKAAAAYREALAQAPTNLTWRRALLRIEADKVPPGELEASYVAAADPELRLHLGFALAREAEKSERYDAAMSYLDEANRLVRASLPHDSAGTRMTFAEIERCFTPELFARLASSGNPDPTPIFVLGMPRSGTTLVEQILASHPRVHGGGELPYLRQIVGAAAERIEAKGYADLLARLSREELTALGTQYMHRLRQLSDRSHIVDKLPGNFLLAGMIRLMLPNATILHVTRDPADNALSIWKNYFGDQLTYAYDITELGEYHRLYRSLMRHWHQVLPGGVRDVSYEALVADQRGETERLLDHAGLAFHPACLRFYETRRPVHTVSISQVRAPVTDRSIGLARRYGAGLEPLLKALGSA